MGQYVGLDVSLEVTTVHVLDDQGKRVWRGTCVTHPTAIEATIRKHAPEVVRIGLETGPLTTWLWQALTDAGLPMVCLDARQARAALNMKINKTTMRRAWLTWCVVSRGTGQEPRGHAGAVAARRADTAAGHRD